MIKQSDKEWYVYVIRCTDGSLYTGITINILRRWAQHRDGCGARYFRGHLPEEMVLIEYHHTHQSASRREYEIKQLSRREKLRLVDTGPDGTVPVR